jgi:hypothetical protein
MGVDAYRASTGVIFPDLPRGRRLHGFASPIYLDGYAEAWREAFGTCPAVRDPLGYGPLER